MVATSGLVFEQAGIEVQAPVRAGHPAGEIVAFATASQAELVTGESCRSGGILPSE